MMYDSEEEIKIEKKEEGEKCIISIEGKVDTITASTLEDYYTEELKKYNKVIIDIEKVEYMSSAGLRALLIYAKKLGEKMELHKPNEMVKEVLEVTGFTDILKIVE